MKINKQDLKQITYGDFGKMLDKLTEHIRSYCEVNKISFDLVVPILRSGAITGMHIASKFKITNILPTQYKYLYQPTEQIIKKFEFPEINFSLSNCPNILITDSNTVFGGIAAKVIEDVRNKFSKSKIYFASANLDQSKKTLEDVEHVFYGELSNEKRELTEEQEKQLGITHEVIIFPWENLEEQWGEINSAEGY